MGSALAILGGVVGGVVGFFAGGNVFLGASIGASIGGMAELARKGVPETKGPTIDEFRAQNSNYGAPIPKVYGSAKLSGNVIWMGPVTSLPFSHEEDGVEYFDTIYYANLAIGICEGPIDSILKIWANNKLIYDITAGSSEIINTPGLIYHWYDGSETQLPDSYIETVEGVNTPAYRGLAYVVFHNLRLTEEFYNAIPTFNFEVTTNSTLENTVVEITGASSGMGADKLVAHPGNGIYIYKLSARNWDKYNVVSTFNQSSAVYGPVEELVPASGSSPFDVDYRGIVYTTYAEHIDDMVFPGEEHFQTLHTNLARGRWDTLDLLTTNGVYWIPTLHGGAKIIAIDIFKTKIYTTNQDFSNPYSTHELKDGATQLYAEMITYDLDYYTPAIYVLCNSATENTSIYITPSSGVFGPSTVEAKLVDVGAYIQSSDFIAVDLNTDQVIVGSPGPSSGQNQISFFSLSDMRDDGVVTHIETLTQSESLVSPNGWSSWHRGVVNGDLWMHTITTIYRVNVGNHTITEYTDLGGIGSLQGAGIYDPITHSYFTTRAGQYNFAKLMLERATGNAVLLSTIVTDICESVGLDASEIDVTELTDEVRGYTLNSRMTARAALEPLMNGFWFDVIESDGKINFIKRGKASIATITEDELGAHPAEAERPQTLVTIRQQEAELPRAVELTYIDQAANYATGVQRASRQSVESEQVANITLAITFSADEAHACALKHLYNAWMTRTRHTLLLPRKYLYLDPGDVITVTEDGNTHVVRIEDLNWENGFLTASVVNEDTSVYTQDGTGVDLPSYTDIIEFPGPTLLAMMDIPLLSIDQNSPGIYVATQGYFTTWSGAQVYSATTAEGPFDPFLTTVKDSIIGYAEDTLADTNDPWLWDYGNSVTIKLIDEVDTLTTVTEAEALSGSNMALLGDEIIIFKTVTANSDGTFTLSDLLRGKKGTEWATGDHDAGEMFVLLSGTQGYHFRTINPDFINQTRYYSATSVGMIPTHLESQAVTWQGRNMKPLSPQHATGARDGSNNLTITWIRRGRYGGEWTDLVGTPLGETSEAYQIDILSGQTVLRSMSMTSASVVYTAAMQTTDGLTPGDNVTMTIYQMSDFVGRGFGSTVTL